MEHTHSFSLLLNKLSHFKMLQALYDWGHLKPSRFILSLDQMPAHWDYAVFAGLEPLLEELEALQFTDHDIDYLSSLELFSTDFLNMLRDMRFTGSVRAVKEGTILFAGEPFLEVSAPLVEAQLIAPVLMNFIKPQIEQATRAARSKMAAKERSVSFLDNVDHLSERQEFLTARAHFIGGIDHTATPSGARALHLPFSHVTPASYLKCFENEIEAFRAFTNSYDRAVLLVDYFDLEQGLGAVKTLQGEQGDDLSLQAIAISRAPFDQAAQTARETLDQCGLEHVEIFACGPFDEETLAKLTDLEDCPIDSFIIGTEFTGNENELEVAPVDQISLGYQMHECDGQKRLPESQQYMDTAGPVQIYRLTNDHLYRGDTIASNSESLPGTALLHRVMEDGVIHYQHLGTLDEIKEETADALAHLPADILSTEPADKRYPVGHSQNLKSFKVDTTVLAAPLAKEGHHEAYDHEDEDLSDDQYDDAHADLYEDELDNPQEQLSENVAILAEIDEDETLDIEIDHHDHDHHDIDHHDIEIIAANHPADDIDDLDEPSIIVTKGPVRYGRNYNQAHDGNYNFDDEVIEEHVEIEDDHLNNELVEDELVETVVLEKDETQEDENLIAAKEEPAILIPEVTSEITEEIVAHKPVPLPSRRFKKIRTTKRVEWNNLSDDEQGAELDVASTGSVSAIDKTSKDTANAEPVKNIQQAIDDVRRVKAEQTFEQPVAEQTVAEGTLTKAVEETVKPEETTQIQTLTYEDEIPESHWESYKTEVSAKETLSRSMKRDKPQELSSRRITSQSHQAMKPRAKRPGLFSRHNNKRIVRVYPPRRD